MKRYTVGIGCFVLLQMLIQACGPTPQAILEPTNTCWAVEAPLEVMLSEHAGSIQGVTEVRLEEAYPFQNIYLKYHLVASGAASQAALDTTWTQNIQVSDPLGNWAIPAQGGSYVLEVPFSVPVKGENYRLDITHHMRPDSLCGVSRIQFFLPQDSEK